MAASIPGPSTAPAQSVPIISALPLVDRSPPANWASAEQEKLRLYNEARSRAVAAQTANGAQLDTLGLDDSAPPEYAPPLPAQPAQEYKAPSRPVSMYTSGASPTGQSSPGSLEAGSSGSPPMQPMTSGFMSAADEKEQRRRRFEDAQTRVISSGQRQVSNPASPLAGPSTQLPPAQPPASTGYMSAAEEKDQQRQRFEAAQSRVVSAGRGEAPASPQAGSSSSLPNGNPVPNEDPVPYDSIFPPASSSSAPGQSTSSALSSSTAVSAVPPNSGLSEKEQMKAYHEVQDIVAQAEQEPASVTEPSDPPPVTSPVPSTRSVSVVPVNEKEQMKRYYEAMERVQRASGGGSGSGSSSVSTTAAAPINPSPKPDASTSNWTSIDSPGYMSAAEEKVLMQKRFNDAQAAVQRNFSPTPQSQPNTASSIGHQRTLSSISTAPSSSPPDSPLVRDPTVRAGKAKAIGPRSPTLSMSDGPPPPLPTRPPIEYINLLSPVREFSSSPWSGMLGGTVKSGKEGSNGKG